MHLMSSYFPPHLVLPEQADEDFVIIPGSDEISLFQHDSKGALF